MLHLDIDYSVEAAEDEHKNSGIYKVVSQQLTMWNLPSMWYKEMFGPL